MNATRQTTLFPQSDVVEPRAPTREGSFVVFVQVAVPLNVRSVFTYGATTDLASRLRPGVRVAVRFHGKRVAAFVISTAAQCPAEVAEASLKPVEAVLDDEPVFTAELLTFLKEAADYYLHPLGDVLRTAAPAVDTRARRTLGSALQRDGTLKAKWARVREETFVRLSVAALESPPKLRGGRQASVFAQIEARGEVPLSELRATAKDARAIVRALESNGLVTTETREVPHDPFFGSAIPRDVPPELTEAQRAAVEAIAGAVERGQRATFLLHGVTGSGKTEVYLRSVEAARRAGRGTLILVPEIALTPQLVNRYRARFGDDLAVLHSGLDDNERFHMWRRLRTGESHVGIGARSAIFAPLSQLGLVIVDEEHDASFKQDESFRYNGRDLAILRAHRSDTVCVLGSATPSVESFDAAQRGRYEVLQLPERATKASMPVVEIVDLKRFGKKGPTGHPLLSLPLVEALRETLANSQQAILFLNRRGFAPSVHCERCDETIECRHCSVTMVLHRRAGLLKCHYCDASIPFENVCPKCGHQEIDLVGVGTERVEQALVSAFPGARVARLDRDVASGAGAERVLERLRKGDIDVLVGTQMVTKGHDIERVTLVGVLMADAALAFPDFRATERTFQLLSQVAGRAGRGAFPGRVLVQTFQPTHAVLARARDHDYAGFFADEIHERIESGYPPAGRLIAFRMDSPNETRLRSWCEQLGDAARGHDEARAARVQVLGPAPAPIERVRGRFRMRMMLRATERKPLRAVAIHVLRVAEEMRNSAIRCSVDVDPVNML